jgi:CIC family chloride channel protein
VAVIRTPFTAIIMVFEMTRDYRIILPLMIANAAAYAIASNLHKGSVYESLSEQDGVHLPSREDNEVLENLLIEEAMIKDPFCLNANLTTRDVFKELKGKFEFTGFPVIKNGNLFGMVSLSELAKAHAKEHGKAKIEDIATREIISVYPACSLLVAFHKLNQHQVGRIPVVSRLNHKRLLGLVTAEDIVARFGYHIQVEQKTYDIEDVEDIEN